MSETDHVATARRNLEKAALKYARVTYFGADLEEQQLNDGTWITRWVSYDIHDTETLVAITLRSLGEAACSLLRELSARDEPTTTPGQEKP